MSRRRYAALRDVSRNREPSLVRAISTRLVSPRQRGDRHTTTSPPRSVGPALSRRRPYRTTEAIIVGAVPGTGPNAATFGGLVLAGHTPEGRLHCIGGVGTGFNTETRRSLRAALEEIRRGTSPLDDPAPASVRRAAWWVEPVLVADIEYREVSGDGLLRHPSFRGIRTDKTSDEIGLPN